METIKKEFKGTKGEWYFIEKPHPVVSGAKLAKIMSDKSQLNGVRKSIGTINACQKEEGEANAKLISAAPDLLEAALNLVENATNSYDPTDDTVFSDKEDLNKLKQAIEKAL